MDKLTETISFKVSPRVKRMIQEKAIEFGGGDLSALCRKWVFEKLHESDFHMSDYLKHDEEGQAD